MYELHVNSHGRHGVFGDTRDGIDRACKRLVEIMGLPRENNEYGSYVIEIRTPERLIGAVEAVDAQDVGHSFSINEFNCTFADGQTKVVDATRSALKKALKGAGMPVL